VKNRPASRNGIHALAGTGMARPDHGKSETRHSFCLP